MPSSGNSSPDPTAAAAEELRWRLGALVSRHGERLATDAEAWRACELELSAFYSGPYAVRTYAVVQALKGGLVADLVSWHREGARGIDGEIAQRLTERSGVARPIAEWAVAQWAFAFGLHGPATHAAAAPAATPTAAAGAAAGARVREDVRPDVRADLRPRGPAAPPASSRAPAAATRGGRELVLGVPHLVAVGALAAAALTAVLASSDVARARVAGLFGETQASAPALPPAPAIEGVPIRARQWSAAGDVEAR